MDYPVHIQIEVVKLWDLGREGEGGGLEKGQRYDQHYYLVVLYHLAEARVALADPSVELGHAHSHTTLSAFTRHRYLLDFAAVVLLVCLSTALYCHCY